MTVWLKYYFPYWAAGDGNDELVCFFVSDSLKYNVFEY